MNPYPFFGYSPETLDFALFRPNPGLFDQDTKLHYTNMFDAQLDSVYSAMERLGFSDVAIVVGEIGWPSKGDRDQIGVDVATAAEFNRKVMDRVNSGTGTPLMPNRTFETYIFALFNENLKPGPISERNFGLFRSDLTPVYDIGILRPTVIAAAFRCVSKNCILFTSLVLEIDRLEHRIHRRTTGDHRSEDLRVSGGALQSLARRRRLYRGT